MNVQYEIGCDDTWVYITNGGPVRITSYTAYGGVSEIPNEVGTHDGVTYECNGQTRCIMTFEDGTTVMLPWVPKFYESEEECIVGHLEEQIK